MRFSLLLLPLLLLACSFQQAEDGPGRPTAEGQCLVSSLEPDGSWGSEWSGTCGNGGPQPTPSHTVRFCELAGAPSCAELDSFLNAGKYLVADEGNVELADITLNEQLLAIDTPLEAMVAVGRLYEYLYDFRLQTSTSRWIDAQAFRNVYTLDQFPFNGTERGGSRSVAAADHGKYLVVRTTGAINPANFRFVLSVSGAEVYWPWSLAHHWSSAELADGSGHEAWAVLIVDGTTSVKVQQRAVSTGPAATFPGSMVRPGSLPPAAADLDEWEKVFVTAGASAAETHGYAIRTEVARWMSYLIRDDASSNFYRPTSDVNGADHGLPAVVSLTGVSTNRTNFNFTQDVAPSVGALGWWVTVEDGRFTEGATLSSSTWIPAITRTVNTKWQYENGNYHAAWHVEQLANGDHRLTANSQMDWGHSGGDLYQTESRIRVYVVRWSK